MIYDLVARYLDGGQEQAELIGQAWGVLECSTLVRAFILNNELGARDWVAGEVYADGELITRLAYNGQIYK